jgi:hypothetical protein
MKMRSLPGTYSGEKDPWGGGVGQVRWHHSDHGPYSADTDLAPAPGSLVDDLTHFPLSNTSTKRRFQGGR